MSSNAVREKPKPIQKMCIVPRSFYIRSEKSSWNPTGIIKLYRMTRTPEDTFAYHSVRIKTPEEMAKVKISIDLLASHLNWQELPEILDDFKKEIKKDEKSISPTTLKLIQEYPEAANQILKGFDAVFKRNIEVEDFPVVQNVIKTASMLLTNQTKLMTETKIELFKRLSREKTPEGIKNLTKLLEKHDLPQLTSVASIIMDRLQRIKYLKATIEEETAYELMGEDSIHNQLAKSLWMIDDSYWLLYANRTLSTFLGKSAKMASETEKKRPDLICATDNDRLVIVELKRPSHKIEQKDIQQLQNYLITADQFRSPAFNHKAGFLIGKEISAHDQKFIDQIPSLKFKPYVQLIEDCERRYQEYLKAIEANQNQQT